MFIQDIKNRIDQYKKCENILEGLRGLVATAKSLHSEERKISLLSVQLVGLLMENNAAVNSYMSQQSFAYHIGLTPDQYWKRSQTFRVLKNFPEFVEMIECGETCASHVAMLSSKITEANAEVMATGIKNKSTREVRDFIAAVTPDGRVRDDKDTFIDIKLRLSKNQLEVLERAREILAHSGQVPTTEDLVMKALTELVERKDPLKKSERALNKMAPSIKGSESKIMISIAETALKQASESELHSSSTIHASQVRPASKQWTSRPPVYSRIKVPALMKHKVWQRHQGLCTHQFSGGNTCSSRMMLEIDHIIPVAKGGQNNLENLTLKCRQHNVWRAVQVFGIEHMSQFRN